MTEIVLDSLEYETVCIWKVSDKHRHHGGRGGVNCISSFSFNEISSLVIFKSFLCPKHTGGRPMKKRREKFVKHWQKMLRKKVS